MAESAGSYNELLLQNPDLDNLKAYKFTVDDAAISAATIDILKQKHEKIISMYIYSLLFKIHLTFQNWRIRRLHKTRPERII